MTKKDFKLYGSLILYALLPSVYLLIRIQIVAVSGVDINIMGQIEWFDLIDEVLVTALTVPLYFLLKPDKEKQHRIRIVQHFWCRLRCIRCLQLL